MDTGETATSAAPRVDTLPSAPPATTTSPPPAIKRGTRVRLDGLVSATHLNKQIGCVTTPPSSFTHRYNVIMEETGEIVLVLFEKLQPCAPVQAARRRSLPGHSCASTPSRQPQARTCVCPPFACVLLQGRDGRRRRRRARLRGAFRVSPEAARHHPVPRRHRRVGESTRMATLLWSPFSTPPPSTAPPPPPPSPPPPPAHALAGFNQPEQGRHDE